MTTDDNEDEVGRRHKGEIQRKNGDNGAIQQRHTRESDANRRQSC